MSLEDEQLSRHIRNIQPLPIGRCTRCNTPTGLLAPYYAQLEIEEPPVLIRLPFCQACADNYSRMIESERPDRVKVKRKSAA